MTTTTIFTGQSWSLGNDSPITAGNAFTVDAACTTTRGRYYKGDSANDTRTMSMGLWDGGGSLIASGSRVQTSADPTGFIWVDWSASASLATGQTYIIGYYDPLGHYSFISSAPAIDNSPLHTTTSPGRYLYGGSLALPTNTSGAAFGVDVEAVSAAGLTGTASRPTTATLAAAGLVAGSRGATLALTATITAAGLVGSASAGSVPVVAALTAVGRVAASTGASAALSATLSATGTVGVTSGSAITATATTVAAGATSVARGAQLAVVTALVAAGTVGTASGAAITATATITAGATQATPELIVSVVAVARQRGGGYGATATPAGYLADAEPHPSYALTIGDQP